MFQLVSVKLTKAAGQDMEAKELSVVLEGVDASPKCTAFGREVYPLLGGLASFFTFQVIYIHLCVYRSTAGLQTH